MNNELDKLAKEMRNVRPSKSSRQRGMDSALAIFDAEFSRSTETAATEVAQKTPKNRAEEKNSDDVQGSATAPRPTGISTSIGHVLTFGSDVMSKLSKIFTYNPRTAMMLGSSAAALLVALIIIPSAIDGPIENQVEEKLPQVVAEAGSDEIIVTGSRVRRDEFQSVSPLTVQRVDKPSANASQNTGGITSIERLLTDVRSGSVNANREAEFKDSLEQRSSSSANLGYVAPKDALSFTISDTPPASKTVSRRVVKTPARTVERVVPAITKQLTRRVMKKDGTFKIVSETVVVQESYTEQVTVPATYETVNEIVVVQNARNQFENYESNPVVSVKETSVSTFSIDVDTASYSFLRASINRGQLPSPNSIRLEEMINYFPYDYEAPGSPDEPFKAHVTVTPTPWNADTKLMHIGIKGYVPAAEEKPRSNIVLLIDTSGSMNQANKLPLLINSFKLLLGTLDADDTVSIVTYAGNAGTVLEPTPASNKHKITEALNRLSSGGSTAGAAGLELAYEKAKESFDEEGVNRVILATDGDFNVGFSSPDEMKKFIKKKRKTGIFLSVLGFGTGNYNDQLMQSLAQNGNGVAAYIDNLAEANKVLADEAGGALITIAKDVKIQVEFNPATISEYRLIGYETRALKREDFNNDAVDAGEIGAGHSVTAIYELTPVGSPARVVDDLRYVNENEKQDTNGSDEYAFVKIRHKLPNADTSSLQTFPIGPGNEQRLRQTSDDMRFATAVAAVGQKLRGDTYLDSFSYADAIKLASSGRGDDEYGYRSEFIQLVRLIDGLKE